MERTPLTFTNPYLKDADKARRALIRSVASSTAIETGEPIHVIEEKLNRSRNVKTRVRLA